MTILALDTCTERMIVGVRSESGDRWINLDAKGNQAQELIPAVLDLLGGAVPEAVGVALGPGSFTGVRIGLATAKGLSEGWEAPLVGLDNLAAMAAAWSRLVPGSNAAVLPAIDARKKKFYGALYQGSRCLVAPADLEPVAWVDAVRAVWSGEVALSGYQGKLLAEALGASLPTTWTSLAGHDWTPGLLDQLEAGWKSRTFLSPDTGPRYLRLSEAEEARKIRP